MWHILCFRMPLTPGIIKNTITQNYLKHQLLAIPLHYDLNPSSTTSALSVPLEQGHEVFLSPGFRKKTTRIWGEKAATSVSPYTRLLEVHLTLSNCSTKALLSLQPSSHKKKKIRKDFHSIFHRSNPTCNCSMKKTNETVVRIRLTDDELVRGAKRFI